MAPITPQTQAVLVGCETVKTPVVGALLADGRQQIRQKLLGHEIIEGTQSARPGEFSEKRAVDLYQTWQVSGCCRVLQAVFIVRDLGEEDLDRVRRASLVEAARRAFHHGVLEITNRPRYDFVLLP